MQSEQDKISVGEPRMQSEQDAISLGRILSFSDGVFAIAITLLVLNITLPEVPADAGDAAIRQAILDTVPQILVFGLSFVVLGLFWYGHHTLFHYIRRFDRRLIYLNLLFLLSITFLPFPTEVLGSFVPSVTTVVFYAGAMTVASLMKWLIWEYASYRHRLVDDVEPQKARRLRIVNMAQVAVFSLSIVIALFDVQLAMYSWNLLWIVQVAFRG